VETRAHHILPRNAPALDEVHVKGVIHRDLKSGNILFDRLGT
jgi:serine/threonine protein kinase